jgi:hypothetical protein
MPIAIHKINIITSSKEQFLNAAKIQQNTAGA